MYRDIGELSNTINPKTGEYFRKIDICKHNTISKMDNGKYYCIVCNKEVLAIEWEIVQLYNL